MINSVKKYLFIMLTIFESCGIVGDSKFIRKEIQLNNGTLKWYYYSYITSMSPDIVLIEKDGNEKEIYKATRVITDISLKADTIILKLVEPSKGLVFTKNVEKEIFGYKIIVDSAGTYEDLNFRPKGIKE